jgi:hypothetical protein
MMTCLRVALITDIFDGIVARRLAVETTALRRYDSVDDTVFYLAVAFAIWKLFPEVIKREAALLTALVGLECARYLVDWVKFKREASYHMWSSKAWWLAPRSRYWDLVILAGCFGRPSSWASSATWKAWRSRSSSRCGHAT